MEKDKTVKIIGLCLKIDRMACSCYHRFSLRSKHAELREFWHQMSQQEAMHVKFWIKILALAKKWALPHVFDYPDRLIADFRAIIPKARVILKKTTQEDCIAGAFLTAYRLEFYLLHPAVALLFHLFGNLAGPPNPEDEYEKHINGFITALAKYGQVTPELDLLGETLARLWQENRALAKQATRDSLTGLLNRRGYFAMASHLIYLAQRQKRSTSVAMLDIDHFKKINDSYGHTFGDRALVHVAQIIESQIRHADLAGRYGGEEFIILMPDTDIMAAVQVVERIRKTLASSKLDKIKINLSAGVSSTIFGSKVMDDLDRMIKNADNQLYRAKESGRNRVCY
jgi:diguanylate cyclase (GGDEF)-like protein